MSFTIGIGVLDGVNFSREPDPATGFDELMISATV